MWHQGNAPLVKEDRIFLFHQQFSNDDQLTTRGCEAVRRRIKTLTYLIKMLISIFKTIR